MFTTIALLTVTICFAVIDVAGATNDREKVKVLFCADNGTFSGASELYYVMKKVHVTRDVSQDYIFCQSAIEGKLYGFTVFIVTTGIGLASSTSCVLDVFSQIKQRENIIISNAFFVGTSGWSPVVGGLNPLKASESGCSVNKRPTLTPVPLGSVCVSNIAFNMACGFDVERPLKQCSSGECWMPDIYAEDSVSIFGVCSFASKEGARIVDEIVAVTSDTIHVPVPEKLSEESQLWWNAFQLGPIDSLKHPATDPPFITTNCAEADDDSIWVGSQKDFVCRQRVAKMLNEKRGIDGAPLSADDVVCVSAMESTGFIKIATQYGIPAVLIRGASDYTYFPLQYISLSDTNAPLWFQNDTYITPDENTAFLKSGYSYAVRTTNNVLLKYLASIN